MFWCFVSVFRGLVMPACRCAHVALWIHGCVDNTHCEPVDIWTVDLWKRGPVDLKRFGCMDLRRGECVGLCMC